MSTKRLVMVVEDEAGIRDMISTLLIANGYSVVTAENGHSAITLIASYNPDIILLDLGLPDMDGLEVLRTVRHWSAVPVIVVSARGQESEKVEALDAGAPGTILSSPLAQRNCWRGCGLRCDIRSAWFRAAWCRMSTM